MGLTDMPCLTPAILNWFKDKKGNLAMISSARDGRDRIDGTQLVRAMMFANTPLPYYDASEVVDLCLEHIDDDDDIVAARKGKKYACVCVCMSFYDIIAMCFCQ